MFRKDRNVNEIDAQIAAVKAEQVTIKQAMDAAIDALADAWGDADTAHAGDYARLEAKLQASHRVLARLESERHAAAERHVVAEYLKVIAAVEKAEAERAEIERPDGALAKARERYQALEAQRFNQRQAVGNMKHHANMDAVNELMAAVKLDSLSEAARAQIDAARQRLYSMPTLIGNE